MRHFNIDCQLAYEVLKSTHFVFHLEAARSPEQEIMTERLQFEPEITPRHFADERSGNRFLRLDVPIGSFKLHYRARVARVPELASQPGIGVHDETPIPLLPDELLHHLTPTRYCESDILGPAAYKIFGDMKPGVERVAAISQWVRDNIEYRIGSSDTTTTSRDVFVQRSGVCRDFAHLCITFCRALGIPARLVVGYVKFEEPPPDFHAVFEAWVGGRWQRFDPTGLAPVDQLVRIGTGRDAKDVAFAAFYGQATMTLLSPEIEEVAP